MNFLLTLSIFMMSRLSLNSPGLSALPDSRQSSSSSIICHRKSASRNNICGVALSAYKDLEDLAWDVVHEVAVEVLASFRFSSRCVDEIVLNLYQSPRAWENGKLNSRFLSHFESRKDQADVLL